jgi:hypothetical protein
VGNEAEDEPSKDFLTANGTGTGREAYKPASYLMTMTTTIMMMMMMICFRNAQISTPNIETLSAL